MDRYSRADLFVERQLELWRHFKGDGKTVCDTALVPSSIALRVHANPDPPILAIDCRTLPLEDLVLHRAAPCQLPVRVGPVNLYDLV